MKIVFKDSELNEGIIKISLDGGFTFTDYEIADVKRNFWPSPVKFSVSSDAPHSKT